MSNKSILILEDEAGYQELFQFVLSAYDLTICSSAEEALVKVENKSFDLMVVDLNLMGLSGLEFLAMMKRKGVTDKTPIILCSGLFDQTNKQSAIENGAAGFVSKPFQNEALRQVVASLIK